MKWATKAKAIVWLHVVRLWRYKLSFLSIAVSSVLWLFLFILGVLLFVPPEGQREASLQAFWVVFAWSFVSSGTWLMGAWVRFLISVGLVEEHMLRGVTPYEVMYGRVIPFLFDVFLTTAIAVLVIGTTFSVNVFEVKDTWILLLGVVLMFLQSLSYGLVITSLSMRTGVPGQLLDVVNMLTIGLLILPAERIPASVRPLFYLIPYTAPMQLIRCGLSGSRDYFALAEGLAVLAVLLTAAASAARSTLRYLRREGVKAVGFM